MKRLEVDLESLEEMKYGVKVIAFTDDPAIVVKGIALSKQRDRKIMFSDDKKMQVVAPLLVPMDVYRYDDEDGEYEIVFTAEAVEAITKQMMRNLPKSELKTMFTNEHTNEHLNAYIFEVLFIDTQDKQAMLKSQYGLDLSIGSTCLTVQCDDKETYNYVVKNGKLGLSIDGLFKLKEVQLKQTKMRKQKVKLTKKLRFRKGYFQFKSKDNEIKVLAFEVDELQKGEKVTIHDEDGEIIDDWTGEVAVMIDGEESTIEVVDGEVENVEVEDDETVDLEEEEKEEKEKEEEEKVDLEEGDPSLSGISTEDITKAVTEALEPILDKLIAIETLVSESITSKEEDEDGNIEMSKDDKWKKGIINILKRN